MQHLTQVGGVLGAQTDGRAKSCLHLTKIGSRGAGDEYEVIALGRGLQEHLGGDEGGHICVRHQHVRLAGKGSDLLLGQPSRDQQDLH